MMRPSFKTTIRALTAPAGRNRPPFDDCADVAEVLRDLEARHRGGPVRDVAAARWGRCSACGEPWPCPAWAEGEQLAVQFLGRAQDRVAQHALEVIARASGATVVKRKGLPHPTGRV